MGFGSLRIEDLLSFQIPKHTRGDFLVGGLWAVSSDALAWLEKLSRHLVVRSVNLLVVMVHNHLVLLHVPAHLRPGSLHVPAHLRHGRLNVPSHLRPSRFDASAHLRTGHPHVTRQGRASSEGSGGAGWARGR